MISLFLKCLLGAAAVLFIDLLSKNKNYFIAGLVPLFPTFALIAHYIIGTERTMENLRTTVLFGICSLIPYLLYMVSVYCLSFKFNLFWTLSTATVIWLLAAFILIMLWSSYNKVLI